MFDVAVLVAESRWMSAAPAVIAKAAADEGFERHGHAAFQRDPVTHRDHRHVPEPGYQRTHGPLEGRQGPIRVAGRAAVPG